METVNILTFGLLIVTTYYAYITHKMLKQSQIDQEIKIREKALEQFYYPLRTCLINHSATFSKLELQDNGTEEERNEEEETEEEETEEWETEEEETGDVLAIDLELDLKSIRKFNYCLQKVVPYSYLASPELTDLFNEFRQFCETDKFSIMSKLKNGKNDTENEINVSVESLINQVRSISSLFDYNIENLWKDQILANPTKFLDIYNKMLTQIEEDISKHIKRINNLTKS